MAGNSVFKSTLVSLEITFTEATEMAAKIVSDQLMTFDTLLSEISTHNVFTDTDARDESIEAFLVSKTSTYSEQFHSTISYADAEGIDYLTGVDITEEAYFQAAPYIIDSSGDTIVFGDGALVKEGYNTKELFKTDPTLTDLAEMETSALRGEVGFATYVYGGSTKIAGYAPIVPEGTEGWSFICGSERNEFTTSLIPSVVLTIGVCVAFELISIFVIYLLANSIVNPIIECTQRIVKLGEGDLHTPIEISIRKDEVGILQNATRDIVDNLQGVVADITKLLTELANRNLDVISEREYTGDFIPIKTAIQMITDSLDEAIGQIGEASTQVEAGSNHVSSGSQELSEGATEQASAIEELAATMVEITEQIKQTAENAISANKLSTEAEVKVQNGNIKVQEVTTAIVDSTKQTTVYVDKIAVACQGQEESVNQITQRVDQISVVVQNNAATAEESAAASEQLTAQSSILKDLVNKFKLIK